MIKISPAPLPFGIVPIKLTTERFAQADAAMAAKIAEQDKRKRPARRDVVSGKFRRSK